MVLNAYYNVYNACFFSLSSLSAPTQSALSWLSLYAFSSFTSCYCSCLVNILFLFCCCWYGHVCVALLLLLLLLLLLDWKFVLTWIGWMGCCFGMSFVFSLLQKQTTKRLLLLSFIAELICHVPPHTRKVCVLFLRVRLLELVLIRHGLSKC